VQQPRIPRALAAFRGALITDGSEVRDSQLRGDFAFQSSERISIDQSRLSGAQFTGSVLNESRLTDVLVEGCDLSGVDFDQSSFTRVEFRDCRMSGAILTRCAFRDVLFLRCRLDEANLRMSEATSIRFEDSNLVHSDLYAAQFQDARFFDCDLSGTELTRAKLAGARFHGSSLVDVKGSDALAGSAIESTQVFEVALGVLSTLGIAIEDDREPVTPPGSTRK
jgi:uncharacterized protein YjbI with pentapeptide repeats